MAAAARPYWTGFLKLSLVTIAVRLYSATTEKERIHFHRIHEPSGERVRYQNVVPGLGPIDSSEIVKGYEYQKGRYVTVELDDLEKLRLETTDTIDIAEFVDAEAVDPVYVDSPYYLVPDGSLAEDGYRVIRNALRDSGKAAIGQVVINTRERVVAIRPYGKGLLVNALRFPEGGAHRRRVLRGDPRRACRRGRARDDGADHRETNPEVRAREIRRPLSSRIERAD